MTNLQNLASQYLYLRNQNEETEKKLETLKNEIVAQTKKKKIKRIKSGKFLLLIVGQSETRFPQLGQPGRKEVEKIIEESGELKEVFTFDIISLGNAYDEGKLKKELTEKLKPFAKTQSTTKIVVKKTLPAR